MVEVGEVCPKVIGLLVLGVAFMFLVKIEALNREKMKDIKIPNENIFAVLCQKIKRFFQFWNMTSAKTYEDFYTRKNQVAITFGFLKPRYNLSTDSVVNTMTFTNGRGSWSSRLSPIINVIKHSADEVPSHPTDRNSRKQFINKVEKIQNFAKDNYSGMSSNKERKTKNIMFDLNQMMMKSFDHKINSKSKQSTASTKVTFTPKVLNCTLKIKHKKFYLLTFKQQAKNLISFSIKNGQSFRSTRANNYQQIKKPYFANCKRIDKILNDTNISITHLPLLVGKVINKQNRNTKELKVQKSHHRKLLSFTNLLNNIEDENKLFAKKAIRIFHRSLTDHLNTKAVYVNAEATPTLTSTFHPFIQYREKYNRTRGNQPDRNKSNFKQECFSKWDVLSLVISVSCVAMMLGCFAAITAKYFICRSCPRKDNFSADKWWSAENSECSLTTFIKHATKTRTSSKSRWCVPTEQNSITPLLSLNKRVPECEM